MDFDSYEPIKQVELPRKKRRPWWRWNLVTLAAALFVLVWTRELAKLPPSVTGLSAATLFFLWGVAPLPWKERDYNPRIDPSTRRLGKRRRRLTACRVLAVLLSATASCGLAVYGYWYFGEIRSAWRFLGNERLLLYLLMHLLGAAIVFMVVLAIPAILWLLAEAVEKLDRLTEEKRSSEQETTTEPRP